MSDFKFTDNRPAFLNKHNAMLDMAMGHMSLDIETFIKISAGTPVKTGNMKSQVRHFRATNGLFRVEADAGYSAVQEAGIRNGSGRFKHYTTAGTGPHWFQRSIDAIIKNRDTYIKEAAKAVGL